MGDCPVQPTTWHLGRQTGVVRHERPSMSNVSILVVRHLVPWRDYFIIYVCGGGSIDILIYKITVWPADGGLHVLFADHLDACCTSYVMTIDNDVCHHVADLIHVTYVDQFKHCKNLHVNPESSLHMATQLLIKLTCDFKVSVPAILMGSFIFLFCFLMSVACLDNISGTTLLFNV